MPVVLDFAFDDRNVQKMAEHGISDRRALEVLEEVHIIVPNRKGRAAPLLLIGLDRGGACISIPIQPTQEDGVWRPITAWPSKEHEKERLRRARSRNNE